MASVAGIVGGRNRLCGWLWLLGTHRAGSFVSMAAEAVLAAVVLTRAVWADDTHNGDLDFSGDADAGNGVSTTGTTTMVGSLLVVRSFL
jgi:hypothetical protein